VCVVVLAAGLGTRLRPLTLERPKPLCPVGGVPLVDLAIARTSSIVSSVAEVAVNVHAGRALLQPHLEACGVQVSVEENVPLGTAGAVGKLRHWIDGRAVVVMNSDAYCDADLRALVRGWDGERVRVLVHGGGPFRAGCAVAGTLLPWSVASSLPAKTCGLFPMVWAPAAGAGLLESIPSVGTFVDCGNPASYLRANLLASGGASVIGAVDVIGGEGRNTERVTESVVWDGARLRSGERLHRAIRTTGGRTVLVR